FMLLCNQGMVKRLGQVMSKSAGNGGSPDELVDKQGADAGRIYEMFIGPPEEDVEWNDAGVNGVVKFLHRVWRLVLEADSIEVTGASPAAVDSTLFCRKVAQTVKKVTDDYDDLRFNTAVAYLMELANAMQDYLQAGGVKDTGWDNAVRTLVKLLNPIGPHVSEEMWERLGAGGPDRGLAVAGRIRPGRADRPRPVVVALTGRVALIPGAPYSAPRPHHPPRVGGG